MPWDELYQELSFGDLKKILVDGMSFGSAEPYLKEKPSVDRLTIMFNPGTGYREVANSERLNGDGLLNLEDSEILVKVKKVGASALLKLYQKVRRAEVETKAMEIKINAFPDLIEAKKKEISTVEEAVKEKLQNGVDYLADSERLQALNKEKLALTEEEG